MKGLQFTSGNKLIPVKNSIEKKIVTNEVNQVVNFEGILHPIQEYINNTYSNQQMLLDKVDKLEQKVAGLGDKINVILINNNENMDKSVEDLEIVFKKFPDFNVRSVKVNASTILETFLKEYKNGTHCFVFYTYSSRLGLINDYLNEHPELELDEKLLIGVSSTAQEFRVKKNDVLTKIPRNKNIIRVITNDELQIASFIGMAKNVNNFEEKNNFILYENDAYGIPFAEAFQELEQNTEGSSFKYYTTDEIEQLVMDVDKTKDKEAHIYSVTFSKNCFNLMNEIIKMKKSMVSDNVSELSEPVILDEDDKNFIEITDEVEHLKKIVFAESYDFAVLNEEQYDIAMKHGICFYTYGGNNTDMITQLQKITENNLSSNGRIPWTQGALLGYDAGLINLLTNKQQSKIGNYARRSVDFSRVLYGLSGALKINKLTYDRDSSVSDVGFLEMLPGNINQYITSLKITNNIDYTTLSKKNEYNIFDFNENMYMFLTDNGVFQITVEMVKNFNDMGQNAL